MKVWKWFSYEFRGNSSMASSFHSVSAWAQGGNWFQPVLPSAAHKKTYQGPPHPLSKSMHRQRQLAWPYSGTSALGRLKCWANSHCNSITRGPGDLEITFLFLYFLPISQVPCFRAQKQDPVLQPWPPSRANLQKIISLKQISLWLQELIYNSVTAYEAA